MASPAPTINDSALAAFRAYCDHFTIAGAADRHGINKRTFERIGAGKLELRPRLAREIALECDMLAEIEAHWNNHATALRDWVDQRYQWEQ
jgi:hypothetical protein